MHECWAVQQQAGVDVTELQASLPTLLVLTAVTSLVKLTSWLATL